MAAAAFSLLGAGTGKLQLERVAVAAPRAAGPSASPGSVQASAEAPRWRAWPPVLLVLVAPACARRRRGAPKRAARVRCHATPAGYEPGCCKAIEALELQALGGSSFDKALQVNLDPSIYGSFAEIGAGQEVSRTFLQAGAAAGTVAKSVSAYDMQMSDALYGRSKRYVTLERLRQMLEGEFNDLEAFVREGKAAWGGKGPEVRFFSFAATLAAKAFRSDRECEGWVGMQYQHAPGAEPSLVAMHVRMSDPTAPLQGEAIGILGTNLIYLCSKCTDPYIISTFLMDGIEEGRLEVDFMKFSGPGFPEGCYDERLLALRMVQFRLAPCVFLEKDAEKGRLAQAVPNDACYKTPIIVQRSRFLPVTNTHQEIMEAARRQISAGLPEGSRAPKCVYNMQIDDLMRPVSLCDSKGRISRIQKFVELDTDRDGKLTVDQVRSLVKGLPPEEVDQLMKDLDVSGTGLVEIDALASVSQTSLVAVAYVDRIDMLEPLDSPVLVSAIGSTHLLAEYLSRYTNQEVTGVVGGGGYSIERGLYNQKAYASDEGGMLEAFGRLFAKKVRILQYPNILPDGTVEPQAQPASSARMLHVYLQAEGHIAPVSYEFITPKALSPGSNKPFCGGSADVIDSIKAGTDEWEEFVPPEVVEIVKKRNWFVQVASGAANPAGVTFKLLQHM